MRLSDIKPNPDNPRTATKEDIEKLKNSITELPKMMKLRPIVVDKNNVIVGGNQRYHALQALGKTEIPDEWVARADDFTEEELKRFVVQDNVSSGSWDWDMVANQYELEDLDAWGISLPIYEEPPIDLPSGDKDGFQQMTFTVSDEQAVVIKQALDKAKGQITGSEGNENSNGNALFYLAGAYNEHS
jgi:hypothetical protein